MIIISIGHGIKLQKMKSMQMEVMMHLLQALQPTLLLLRDISTLEINMIYHLHHLLHHSILLLLLEANKSLKAKPNLS